MTDAARSVLTNYKASLTPTGAKIEARYHIEHNNGKTSLEQKMQITGETGFMEDSWIATIALDDFPPQKTPENAALKLADWCERLAKGIRSGDYSLPALNSEFTDLEQPND